ncbi:MAG: thioredoxin-disulfide reductase [Candidatus Woesearchaeota archaeon]
MLFKLETSNIQNLPEEFDVIIIGAGPAGYGAGIYARRFNLSVLIIGYELGGMASEAIDVENYPGFERITGSELMAKFKKHCESLGCYVLKDKVVLIDIIDQQKRLFKILTESGKEFKAKAVIIATGSRKRKLNIQNEDKFVGKGVSYCAVCDGSFYRDKVVAVVGGGDSALNDTYILSNIAKKIYLLVRGDSFRAAPFWVEKLKTLNNVEVLTNTEVLEIIGEEKLESIRILRKKENIQDVLKIDGLFISIGIEPSVELAKQLNLDLDAQNRIKVDLTMKTNQPGVFAAGDCTNACPHMQQIITSAAQGAVAAESVYKYLKLNSDIGL